MSQCLLANLVIHCFELRAERTQEKYCTRSSCSRAHMLTEGKRIITSMDEQDGTEISVIAFNVCGACLSVICMQKVIRIYECFSVQPLCYIEPGTAKCFETS